MPGRRRVRYPGQSRQPCTQTIGRAFDSDRVNHAIPTAQDLLDWSAGYHLPPIQDGDCITDTLDIIEDVVE